VGRSYYLLLTAFLTSSLGNWIYRLALPLLVLELTGSALQTALIYVLEYAPFLLFSLPGGVFADRFDRRRLLISGDLLATVIVAGLAVLVWTDVPFVWPIYVAAFLLASVEPLYHPAFQSFLPSLVEDESLEKANAWMQGGENLLTLTGPVAGGALVAFLGYQTALLIDAVTFAVSAVAIAAIPAAKATAKLRKAAGQVAAEVRAEVREGIAYVARGNRLLLAGSLLFTATNLGIWLVQANFVYYMTEYLRFDPTAIGIVLAGQGAGAILGSMAAVPLRKRISAGRLILGCTILAGLGMLLLIPARSLPTITLAWGLVYALGSINVVAWFSMRQRIVPRELLGRVVAITRLLAFASIPVASLAAGVLEELLHNMYWIIALGALVRVLAGLIGSRTPLNQRQNEPATEVGSA
jgi:MFS family permease